MRIGFDGRVLQDHFPGIGRYAYHLARAVPSLAPDDHVTIFVDPAARNRRFPLETLAAPNVAIVPLASAKVFSLPGQLRAARAIDALGLDVFHAPYLVAPLGLRTPMVVTVHDVFPLRHTDAVPSPVSRLAYRALLWRVCRAARHIIADSAFVARELVAFRLAAAPRVTPILLAADGADRPIGSLPPGCPPPPFLLYVGIDKPTKNLALLVRAHAASGVAIPLVLAGPTDARHTGTTAAIAALGASAKVARLGMVDDGQLGALYANALAFCFPSRAEGFGLPPLEAMQAGLPVISSDAESLPEVVGDAALIVPPDDEAGWAAAIRRVVADADLRARLRDAGRRQAQRFSWTDTARQTLEVYRRVVRAIARGRSA